MLVCSLRSRWRAYKCMHSNSTIRRQPKLSGTQAPYTDYVAIAEYVIDLTFRYKHAGNRCAAGHDVQMLRAHRAHEARTSPMPTSCTAVHTGCGPK